MKKYATKDKNISRVLNADSIKMHFANQSKKLLKNGAVPPQTIQRVLENWVLDLLKENAQEIRTLLDHPAPSTTTWHVMLNYLKRFGITAPPAQDTQEALKFVYNSSESTIKDAPAIEDMSTFPHKGKHQPSQKAEGNAKALCAETSAGKPAKYLSRNPSVVIPLETEAMKKGLKLTDGTIIHIFANPIGADQGEMTNCIRIDGDHGHPIIRVKSGCKTSFDSYIMRELQKAATNQARMQEITKWITDNKLNIKDYIP